MSISFDVIRVGQKYYLQNYGERHEFEVLEKKAGDNFLLKDIHTLEKYELYDLIRYGKGKDFEIYELE
jgi:hypothetical protein